MKFCFLRNWTRKSPFCKNSYFYFFRTYFVGIFRVVLVKIEYIFQQFFENVYSPLLIFFATIASNSAFCTHPLVRRIVIH